MYNSEEWKKTQQQRQKERKLNKRRKKHIEPEREGKTEKKVFSCWFCEETISNFFYYVDASYEIIRSEKR